MTVFVAAQSEPVVHLDYMDTSRMVETLYPIAQKHGKEHAGGAMITTIDGARSTDGHHISLRGRPMVVLGTRAMKYGYETLHAVFLTHQGQLVSYRVPAAYVEPFDPAQHELVHRHSFDEYVKRMSGGSHERLSTLRRSILQLEERDVTPQLRELLQRSFELIERELSPANPGLSVN